MDADYRRVAVIAPNVRLDLALPGDLTVADLLPEILDLARITGPTPPHGWQLSRVGRPGLPLDGSLDQWGVRDGELLLLRTDDGPAQLPISDEITDAVAAVAAEQGGTPPSRVGTVAVAVAAGVLAAALPVALAARSAAAPVLTAAAVFLLMTAVAFRGVQQQLLPVLLGVAGLGYTGIAVVGLLQPTPAAEMAVVAGVMAAGSPLLAVVLGVGLRLFAVVTVLSSFGALGAAGHAATGAAPAEIAAVLLVAATTALPWVPRLAAATGRLTPPDSRPAAAESELRPMELSVVQSAAARTSAILDGVVLGVSIIIGLSAILLVRAGGPWSITLAGLGLLVLLMQAQSARIGSLSILLAVPATAGLVGCLVLVIARLSTDGGAWLPVGAAVVATLIGGSGVWGAGRRWSPGIRRAARACEAAAVIAIVPVAVAAVGGYAIVRHS